MSPTTVPPTLRSLQIIVGALVLGVVSFAAVALVVKPAGAPPADLGMLRMVCLLMLVTMVPASLIARHLMLRRNEPRADNPFAAVDAGPDPQADAQACAARFQQATIVGCALLESVSLFALILFLLGRDPVDLVLAGVPVLLMVTAFFPTERRWRRFVTFHGER
ncbi:MAG: hypothetical protein ACYTG1_12810 [Planctomycetota bacterium]|jgi:hypothetical protein